MDEVDLTTSRDLLFNRRLDHFHIEMGNNSVNGKSVLGWSFNHTHVTQAQQRHMQRSWNGRFAHGHDIHILSDLLEPLLVANTKALLLVHNQKPQIPKFNIL